MMKNTYKRRVCKVEGCNRQTRNKGLVNGRTRYDNVCGFHHLKSDDPYWGKRLSVDNSKCQRCGWDKAYCDRHRINPALGYRKENILILCPNCHRLETLRVSDINGKN